MTDIEDMKEQGHLAMRNQSDTSSEPTGRDVGDQPFVDPTISISPGARQRHRCAILKVCCSLSGTIRRIEDAAAKFDDDECVIDAVLTKYLTEDSSALTYLIGQCNGALVMPDTVKGRSV